MLAWDPVNRYGQHWLTLHGVEVALVSDRQDPAWPWLVSVNRHRSFDSKLVAGKAKTLAHAKKMAERWARVNLARLEIEVADRLARRRR